MTEQSQLDRGADLPDTGKNQAWTSKDFHGLGKFRKDAAAIWSERAEFWWKQAGARLERANPGGNEQELARIARILRSFVLIPASLKRGIGGSLSTAAFTEQDLASHVLK